MFEGRRTHGTHKTNAQKFNSPSEQHLSKRQKVGAETSDHKGASQRRWKFTEGQTWLPSKLSSKARGASKAADRDWTGFEALAQSHKNEPRSSVSTQYLSTIHGQGPHMHHRHANNKTASTQPDSDRVDSGLATMVDFVQNIPVTPTSRMRRSDRRSRTAVELIESSSATSSSPKELQDDTTLSLEKDAARIADLIAVKRKENDLNMFRERLIQRQIKHMSQRGQGLPGEGGLVDELVLGGAYAGEDAETHTSSNVRLPYEYTNPFKPLSSRSSLRRVDKYGLSSTQQDCRRVFRGGVSTDDRSENNTSKTPAMAVSCGGGSSVNAIGLGHSGDEWELLFGRAISSNLTASNHHDNVQHRFAQMPRQTLHDQESGCFEIEDAEYSSQLAALSGGSLLRAPSKQPQSGGFQPKRPRHSDTAIRHHLSSLPDEKLHSSLKLDFTPDLAKQKSTTNPIGLVTSSQASLSLSPTIEAARQIAHMNISASSNLGPPGISDFYKSKVCPTEGKSGKVSHNRTADGRTGENSAQCTAEPNPPRKPAYHRQSVTARSTDVVKQDSQHPHSKPPVMTSKKDVAGSKVRASSGKAAKSRHVSARVNMFGDTKRTTLSTREVIRQIEMI